MGQLITTIHFIIRSLVAAGILLISQPAAAVLIVSGDANLGNALDGSLGVVDQNNKTWFSNILGAGSVVKIQNDRTSDTTEVNSANAINNYYASLAGVSSTFVAAGTNITATLLTGVDLYISMLPANNFAADEIAAMGAYLSAGGTLLFLGEWSTFGDVENAAINAALTALGSTMQIVSAFIDAGSNTTTNIDSDPLNSGVTSFTYAATSLVSGGTSLLRTRSTNQTFVAYESSIPEPATLALMGLGLAGIGAVRRKKPAA